MRHLARHAAVAALLGILTGAAGAQTPQWPPTLPANTVVGRLGVGTGPAEAIPFATLLAQLSGQSITLNSGNGQTAPGAMNGGGTYSFGANTDLVRFGAIGVGGAAPATGTRVYNAFVNPTGNGQSAVGADSANGGQFGGQGTVYDAQINNKSAAAAFAVPTGTQNAVLFGTLTAASLSTVGTIAGSLCMTSGGLVLYEASINCFSSSGVVVVSGKTLTVDNTLEFAGTDGTVFTFPGTSDTVGTLGSTQTYTGNKTFSGTVNLTGTGQIAGVSFGTFATQNFATPPAIGGTTPAAGAFTTLTATTPLGLSSGGSNASTAAGARASGGYNIEGLTNKGDLNYSILSTDRTVGTSATLTAPRTWTLPAASTVNAGQSVYIMDFAGGVTGTNTLTIARAGSDTINGATSVALTVTSGGYMLVSNGASAWSAQPLGAQATAGVSSINGQTGNPNIVAGTGVSVNTAGGNITVANTGVTSATPGGGLVSSVTTSCSQTAVTTTGTLSGAQCPNAQTGTSYAIVDGDRGKLITASNAAAQAYTIAQAGAASAFQSGWFATVSNISTNAAGIVTITPTTSTINGAATFKLYQGQSVTITSDGTNYKISNLTSPSAGVAAVNILTNSIGSNVAMNNTANFFDGPSIAQGTSGTWYASGNATIADTAGIAAFICKLWDGTTVIDSTRVLSSGASVSVDAHLSGILASPAGNLRISCKDQTSTSGVMYANVSSETKDSTITAYRLQ